MKTAYEKGIQGCNSDEGIAWERIVECGFVLKASNGQQLFITDRMLADLNKVKENEEAS